MRYEETLLAVDQPTARRRIAERVPNLRTSTEGNRTEYRTNAGLLLAVLTDVTLPSGERGSKLRYRTAIIGGHHVHARTTARRIRDAVAGYTLDPSGTDTGRE